MEKERKILSGSQIFSAVIGAELFKFIRDDQFTLFSNLVDKQRRGTHKGIKLITSIDHSTAPLVSELLAIGLEIKHRPDSDPIEFVVSDSALLDITRGRARREFLIENDNILVRDYLNKFEQLWMTGSRC